MALTPYICAVEDGFSDLLPRGVRVKILTDQLLAPSMKERFDAWAVAIGAGFLLPNEVRENENLEPIEQEQAEPPEPVEGAE
jgi:phage portal protein BeeE